MTRRDDVALTTAELSKRLRVAEITIRHWRMKGKGPKFYKFDNGSVRYYLSDVMEWEKHGRAKNQDG